MVSIYEVAEVRNHLSAFSSKNKKICKEGNSKEKRDLTKGLEISEEN